MPLEPPTTSTVLPLKSNSFMRYSGVFNPTRDRTIGSGSSLTSAEWAAFVHQLLTAEPHRPRPDVPVRCFPSQARRVHRGCAGRGRAADDPATQAAPR